MDKKNRFVTDFPFFQGLRVLVVDNNVDCCDLIELMLHIYGVEVRKALLAQEALEILVEWQPDILVSEIALPEVDGFTLAQRARTITAGRGKVLLVIAVTAYISKEMRQLALSDGFDWWFTKPLALDDFLTVLAYWAIAQFLSLITQRTLSNVANNSYLTFQEHRPNLILSGVS
jgi:two-component system, OmpR family, response regulator